MKKSAVAVASLLSVSLVGFFTGVLHSELGLSVSMSFSLLALGATVRPSSYSGEKGRLVLAVAGGTGVVFVTYLTDIPTVVAVVSVSAVVVGEAGATVLDGISEGTLFFVVGGGTAGGVAGYLATGTSTAVVVAVVALAVFAGATARSVGASLWLTVVVTAFGGWLATLVVEPSASVVFVGGAAVFVVALAVGAYIDDAMDVSGASAGALLSYVVLVAGGIVWFFVLAVFVATGSATTRYGLDEKEEMGIADHDEGRGFKNVAANGAVAFVAVVVYAVSSSFVVESVAALGFVGCMATATADTASSEIGTVAGGEPRLITTLERVPPGTDGGVSWQGELITLVASVVVGIVAYAIGFLTVEYAAVAAFGGIVGAHADSLLGATLEGKYLDNEGVNLSACAVGAVTAGAVGYLL
ncbi:MAG: DUF92 domain-containing protein [Halobacteriales archaeon]|nr:DUF92 domain-containing protein [Halobacteriales archaeon]